jgi:hypothetical protein
MSEQCALADNWLHSVADGAPPDDLVAHVTGCPRCRLALIALLSDRIAPAARQTDLPCELAEVQIPAFVDYEQDLGLVLAVRAFPDVWWHTLTCPDCDELYRALHELAAMPEAPWAGAVALAAPPMAIQAQIVLHPGVVSQFLRARHRLGAHWGAEQDDVIIAEQRGEIGVIQVSLRHELAACLALVIRTDPPIEGAVVLAMGGDSYSEPLDSNGCAVFSGLAESLFGGIGQQITLSIRPPER